MLDNGVPGNSLFRIPEYHSPPAVHPSSSGPKFGHRFATIRTSRSDHSEATARYAAEIAGCFNASLSVVYVYEPVPLGDYVCESTFTILEEERDRLCKLLGELAQKVKPSGLMCKAVFLVGDPAEQIARWASPAVTSLRFWAAYLIWPKRLE